MRQQPNLGLPLAADTGSGVKGHHIDFYTGFVDENPFPDLAAGESRRFEAYFIKDAEIYQQLLDLHTQ